MSALIAKIDASLFKYVQPAMVDTVGVALVHSELLRAGRMDPLYNFDGFRQYVSEVVWQQVSGRGPQPEYPKRLFYHITDKDLVDACDVVAWQVKMVANNDFPFRDDEDDAVDGIEKMFVTT